MPPLNPRRCSKEYTNFYCCRFERDFRQRRVPRSTQISTVVDIISVARFSTVPRSTQISTVVDYNNLDHNILVPRSTQISTVVDEEAFTSPDDVPRSTQISTVVDFAIAVLLFLFQGVHKFLLL